MKVINYMKAFNDVAKLSVNASSSNLAEAVNGCSSFQIQLSISHFHPHVLSSLFRNFHSRHWKYTAAGFL